MLVLETGEILSGKAGTAAAITWTLHLDNPVTNTDSFKKPQGVLGVATATMFTAPGTGPSLIREITFVNTGVTNVTGITLYMGGTGTGNQVLVFAIPAGGSATFDGHLQVKDSTGALQTTGSTGPSSTLVIGTTSTLVPGSVATAANSGTPTAVILDLGIPAGSVIRNGAGAPSNGLGVNGDYYINTTTWDLYFKSGGTYSVILNIRGAQGIQGVPGVVQTIGYDATILPHTGDTAIDPKFKRAPITGAVSIPDGSNVAAIATDLALPGNPTTTTQTPGNNSTRIATTAYADLADIALRGTGASPSIEPDDAAVIGTSTRFAREDHQHAIVTDPPVDIGSANAEGAATSFARSNHVHNHGDQNAIVTRQHSAQSIEVAAIGATTPTIVKTAQTLMINLNKWNHNFLDYAPLNFTEDDQVGGGTESGAIINAILAQIAADKGGILNIPRLFLRQTVPIIQNAQNCEILGTGGGYFSDIGNFRDVEGACLVWRGAAGQIQMDVFPVAGASNPALKGFHLAGLYFDGRDNENGTDTGAVQADKGLRLRSSHGHTIERVGFMDHVTVALETGVLAPGSLGEAHDCTRGEFRRISIRQVDGTVTPGECIRLGGSTSANTCFNKFDTIAMQFVGANTGKPAVRLQNTDSNTFLNTTPNRAGAGTSNWGWVIEGGATQAEASRANRFEQCSPSANGMILCGTAGGKRPDETADASFNFAQPSANNHIDANTENGEPYVYRGTGVIGPIPGASGGSTFSEQGFRCGGGAIKVVAGGAAVGTNALAQVVGIVLPKWFFSPGTTIEFECTGVHVQTAVAGTAFAVTVRANAGSLGANIARTVTYNTGATARTAPGVPLTIRGRLTCLTAGAAGTVAGDVWVDVPAGTTATDFFTITSVVGSTALNTTINNTVEVTLNTGSAAITWTPNVRIIKVTN